MLTRSGISEAIVVVDNEPAALRFCGAALRRAGYQVLTASSAKQALDFFQPNRTPVALALIDILMPGMTGLELIRASERLNPAKRIVLMSGYGRADMEKLMEDEAVNYRCIWKPFDADTLLRLVQNVLRAPAPNYARRNAAPAEHKQAAHA